MSSIQRTGNNPTVSIVIVCMNNLKNLYPCLNSIKQYTTVSYETLVVAYLFSKENLEQVKRDFPWATFIESDEIRGFSENNNLALSQAKGKYCFVLNDDTEMKMPVIDILIISFEKTPDCSIISPISYFPDGRLQSCGRPKHTVWTWFLRTMRIYNEQEVKSPYIHGKGIFQTYNLVGAFFLIPTDLFKELGWFDERYFFCPEDIALSTKANRLGYKLYVDSEVEIIHNEGGTWSRMLTATQPASLRGTLIFYSENKMRKYLILGIWAWIINLIWLIVSSFAFLMRASEKNKIRVLCKYHNLQSIFTHKSTKEIFIRYYAKLKK